MPRHTMLTVVLLALVAGCGAPQADKAAGGLNAEARLRVAVAAEASGDRDMAVSMYNAAAVQSPDDARVQLLCAEGLARNGQLTRAMSLLNARLRADPQQPDLLQTLGAIQVMAGYPSQAVQTLTEVLHVHPADVRALTDKAVAFDLLHRHAEAQALYRQAMGLAPDDAAIRNDYALSLLLSGQPEQAREMLQPFRDTADIPLRIRTNLGIAAAASGHSGEADDLLQGHVDSAGIAMLTQAIAQQGGKTGSGTH